MRKSIRVASLCLVTGGVLMLLLWLVFTRVHGPTSFNEDRIVFGRALFFWGSMLGGPPNLLVALGLMMLYTHLASGVSRLAQVGYALTVGGLVVSASLDLFVWRALGPPLFIPLIGVGCFFMAAGRWHPSRMQQPISARLRLIGTFYLLAFVLALVPLDLSDQFGGYRLYGIFAHFVTGMGWMALGCSFWKMKVALPLATI